MIVLRCPNVGNGALRNRLKIEELASLDIEQLEELFVRSEGLSAFQDWAVGGAVRFESDKEEKGNGYEEAPSQHPQGTLSKPPRGTPSKPPRGEAFFWGRSFDCLLAELKEAIVASEVRK